MLLERLDIRYRRGFPRRRASPLRDARGNQMSPGVKLCSGADITLTEQASLISFRRTCSAANATKTANGQIYILLIILKIELNNSSIINMARTSPLL